MAKQKKEHANTHSIESKQTVREQLAADVDTFLAKGGQIETVEHNVMADPPKKPESNYGGRAI